MNASHAAVLANATGESRTPAKASITNAPIFYAVYIREFLCVPLINFAMYGGFLRAQGVFMPTQNGSKYPGTVIWQQMKGYQTTSARLIFIALKDKHSFRSATIICGTCLYLSLDQSDLTRSVCI